MSFFLCGCETWTLIANSGKRIRAFETKCLRKLLRISYLELKTNDWVRSKICFIVGPQEEPLLATLKTRKLARFRHVTRHDSLSNTLLQGGEWETLWLAEGMLDGQHQRVDIPARATAAHKGLLQNGLEEDLN